jgi:predicted dehydrogenase
MKPLGVVVIGCGNIAKPYGQCLAPYTDVINVIGAFDLDKEKAAAWTKEFGGKVFSSLEEALADPLVEAVINLTIHVAHVSVIEAALSAGKPVFTEKPLAVEPADAMRLVKQAESAGLVLASAPTVALGEAQQTAIKMVREGKLGKVKMVYAEMNWGRPENWHPNPKAFYEIGAVFDVGVYPLTLATTALGAVRQVHAFEAELMPQREAKAGGSFRVGRPEWTCAMLTFECGAHMRLTTVFYNASKQGGMEFHGDEASLYLASNFEFQAGVEIYDWRKAGGTWGNSDWENVALVREPYRGIDWARGVVDFAEAIRNRRASRNPGAQAAHVVDVIAAIHRSAREHRRITVESSFPEPALMEWSK